MKTNTSVKIIEFIKEKKEVSPKELADFLNLSPQALFKQLKKLLAAQKIVKLGKAPRVYYSVNSEKPPATPLLPLGEQEIINQNYLYITPRGQSLEGVEGFGLWCQNQHLDIAKTATEYVTTVAKYSIYKKDGLISGLEKFKRTFKHVYLDEIYYIDFYSIERFGKTKLGALLLYAKQSQDKVLIKKIYERIQAIVRQLIASKQISAVGFIPPSIPRALQLQKELEKLFNFPLPVIALIKVTTEIAVSQKSLARLTDRIENAKRTIVVDAHTPYKNILLFDDAVGSGATLNEVARKIKEKKLCHGKIIGLAITGSFKGFEVIQEV